MTKLRITVTKEILERTKDCLSEDKGVISNCAIAVAAKDLFPLAKVFCNYISIPRRLSHKEDYITLPEEAIEFIQQFDLSTPQGRVAMEPISFEIDVPDEVLEQISIEELRPLLENHPTLQFVDHGK